MNSGGSNILGAAIFIALVIWFMNHQANKREQELDDRYSAGYEDGRDSVSKDAIAREAVENDPETYCGVYADNKCKEFLSHLSDKYICRER